MRSTPLKKHLIWISGIGLSVAAIARGDDFHPPADKVFTETQLVNYIAAYTDWQSQLTAIEAKIKQTAGKPGNIPAPGVVAVDVDVDAKQHDTIVRHQLTDIEYHWMEDRVADAWGVIVFQDHVAPQSQAQFDAQLKIDQDALADAKRRLAVFQAALKDGKRVLAPEERAAAIQAAGDDETSARSDLKEAKREANDADADAAQHDAEAAAAAAAAKNPPSDLTGDSRTAYIAQKNDDYDLSRSAAADARDRAAEQEKQEAVAEALITADAAKMANPDVPVSDDDKAQAIKDDQAGVAQAQLDIASDTTALTQLQQAQTQFLSDAEASQKSAPAANVTLLRKHLSDWTAAVQDDAATQPSK
jgi:hypothetical protein